jgi:hypothetical protein
MESYLSAGEYVWLENCLEAATLLILRYSGDDDLIDQESLRGLLAKADQAYWDSESGQSGYLLVLTSPERQAIRELISALDAAEAKSRRRHPGQRSWMALASSDLFDLLGRQSRGSALRRRLSPLAA